MILEVNKLKKVYGDKTVVNIDHIQIQQGETIGLVGNNGAGKTTFFRMLLDLIRPSEGEVLSKGKNVADGDEWKNYTASFLDEGFLIDYLTPEEYFTFIGSLNNLSVADVGSYLTQYAEFFNGEILNSGKYIRDFSKGNQNKVGIAAALMQKPELLILDEPFANLDPTTQIRLKKILKEYPGNMTTFISSHDLNHVTDVCSRIILVEKGKVIKDFKTDENTLKELENYFST
ncbi:MAG: ABC transporter ATP-binding protein [Pedobacter sp.]|uniref:ABC transporter ATP-binding protein n=1 Tax=Pedobacter agri TaxID=454586 RepID=UPI00120D7E25|nr:ABC transporter ATP-binding protein [Pedobacter agri]RZL15805.1 MAG: ABC transporter ATP-binding protein [Pedobacter sp.]